VSVPERVHSKPVQIDQRPLQLEESTSSDASSTERCRDVLPSGVVSSVCIRTPCIALLEKHLKLKCVVFGIFIGFGLERERKGDGR